jgi:hypothetical protein
MQIVVRQISGLGNQMFQYAAGRYYTKRHGARMKVAVELARNASSHGYARPFLLSHFAITAPAKEISRIDRLVLTGKRWLKPFSAAFKGFMGIDVYTEKVEQRYRFLPDLPLQSNVRTLYLIGYWQTYRMIDEIADELRAEFNFKEPARGKNLEVLNRIRQSKNPVSLHIRRGDYTLAAEGNIALPLDYYFRAISLFNEQLEEPTFFVFSDDISFAKQNLPHNLNAIFVDHNDDSSSHEDLRLMSACHHHIIANSTFSWWGAWLNPRADKMVYAPKYWLLNRNSYHPDLFPPSWMLDDIPEALKPHH